MTEYLIKLGHQRIGLIIGPYNKVGRVRKRLAGYKSAMEKSGLDIDPALTIETEPTLKNGYTSMSRLLQLSQQPTAVFAASDVLAIGALKAVKDKGLKVPRDISLAGHDDISFAAYTDPPLTTVRVESYTIGRLAVEVLLEAIEKGNEGVKQYCLDTDLIIRESCAELE
jgi:DNA-binding LacI/PurR family transcriptional regulator